MSECQCPTQFPMIRVSEGKYRIGDTKVLIFVRVRDDTPRNKFFSGRATKREGGMVKPPETLRRRRKPKEKYDGKKLFGLMHRQ